MGGHALAGERAVDRGQEDLLEELPEGRRVVGIVAMKQHDVGRGTGPEGGEASVVSAKRAVLVQVEHDVGQKFGGKTMQGNGLGREQLAHVAIHVQTPVQFSTEFFSTVDIDKGEYGNIEPVEEGIYGGVFKYAMKEIKERFGACRFIAVYPGKEQDARFTLAVFSSQDDGGDIFPTPRLANEGAGGDGMSLDGGAEIVECLVEGGESPFFLEGGRGYFYGRVGEELFGHRSRLLGKGARGEE